MNKKLLIPINIEALPIHEKFASNNLRWKDLSVNYEQLLSRQGKNLEDGELHVTEDELYKPGIHLHWALPNALTHGIQQETEYVFPNAPDRWIVIRVQATKSKPLLKQWLIESNHIAPDGSSSWVTVQNNVFTPTAIGKSSIYDETYRESETASTPITAIGPGNAAFAALYASSRNVFGFHDDLKDLQGTGVVSYFVAGWYAKDEHDPLTKNEFSTQHIANKLKESVLAHFELPEEEHDFINFTGLLCYGTLKNVSTQAQELIKYTAHKDINITLANTSLEAKSAQLAEQTKLNEKWLCAFLSDQLKDLSALKQLDEPVSEATFVPIEGGILWEIRPVKSDQQDKEQPSLNDLFADPEIAFNYQSLVTAQHTYDKNTAQLSSLVAALKSSYQKRIIAEGNKLLEDAALQQQNAIKDLLTTTVEELRQAFELITRYEQAILYRAPFFSSKNKKPLFELVKREKPRYWRPMDPCLLLSGKAIKSATKYTLKPSEKLICSTITSKKTAEIEKAEANSFQLYESTALHGENLVVVNSLFNESLLNLKGYTNDHLKDSLQINGLQTWKYPFTPIYLTWYVDFYPAYHPEESHLAENWEYSGKDYKRIRLNNTKSSLVRISGKSLVSEALNDILEAKLPPTIDIEDNFSQLLGGFSERLLMRLRTINLPPLKFNENRLVLDNDLSDFLTEVGLENSTIGYSEEFAPHINPNTHDASEFFPIRAGHLKVSYLALTDAFGQVRELINNLDPAVIQKDKSIKTTEDLKDPDSVSGILLKPRIIQPSRINFRWSASDEKAFKESNSNPNNSPICGWILPDYLEKGFHFYSASGKSYGSLHIIKDRNTAARTRLLWTSAPGEFNRYNDIDNPFLQEFINTFYNDGYQQKAKELEILLGLCFEKTISINNSNYASSPPLSKLMGQPLALTRAFVQPELYGFPAQAQNWASDFKTTANWQNIRFPIHLGDFNLPDDGLLGYFTDDTAFNNLYLPLNTVLKKSSSFFSKEPISTTFNEERNNAVGLTLLMDPYTAVNAYSAILPTKQLELPGFYLDGLHQLDMHLLLAPVIGQPDVSEIPISNEQDKTWELLRRMGPEAWDIKQITDSTDQDSLAKGLPPKAYEGFLRLKTDNSKN